MHTRLRNSRILFVDDAADLRNAIERQFASMDLAVETAGDGNEAIAKLERGPFDAIVVDIIMPDKDGVETIMEVVTRWPRMAIVAISGGGRIDAREFLELASAFGAHVTLTKPFTGRDLLDALEAAMMRADPDKPEASNDARPARGD